MPIADLLARSAATAPFRDAVLRFLDTGQPCAHVSFQYGLPRVKVERTLIRLLERYPEHPIERVHVEGASGCEYFRGVLEVHAADRSVRVRFEWNCRWRAEQLGWIDWFGLPDQARAAREFGHDCFSEWEEHPIAAISAA
jgi:hypothetical protein